MAENYQVIILMLALMVGGFLITFNLIPSLGLGFNSINGIISGFWIILVRLTGVALLLFPLYVIYNIIRG